MDVLQPPQSDQARKDAHERILELAGVYRNLSRRELARALGRDCTKLMSANGNPKLDYVVRLAQLLDWPVGDVAEAISGDHGAQAMDGDHHLSADATFDELDQAARQAHQRGEYAAMCEIARRMAIAADSPDRRALAALRESGGWDGLGRYANQLEAVRRGLGAGPSGEDLRLLLQVNLANAYYTLGHLFEACGMARELIERFKGAGPTTRSTRAANAFAHFVLGNAFRRLMGQEPEQADGHARAARESLQHAKALYTALADEFNHEPWRGVANTCRGGIIETEVQLGMQAAVDAIAAMTVELLTLGSSGAQLVGDRLESYGWWCVFGCNIALRHLDGAELQRHMAVLTEKGFAIANQLNNWAMREQLFTLELKRRQRLNELAGLPLEWMIDHAELRMIVGTMGRLPSFRRAGWRILETTTVVPRN